MMQNRKTQNIRDDYIVGRQRVVEAYKETDPRVLEIYARMGKDEYGNMINNTYEEDDSDDLYDLHDSGNPGGSYYKGTMFAHNEILNNYDSSTDDVFEVDTTGTYGSYEELEDFWDKHSPGEDSTHTNTIGEVNPSITPDIQEYINREVDRRVKLETTKLNEKIDRLSIMLDAIMNTVVLKSNESSFTESDDSIEEGAIYHNGIQIAPKPKKQAKPNIIEAPKVEVVNENNPMPEQIVEIVRPPVNTELGIIRPKKNFVSMSKHIFSKYSNKSVTDRRNYTVSARFYRPYGSTVYNKLIKNANFTDVENEIISCMESEIRHNINLDNMIKSLRSRNISLDLENQESYDDISHNKVQIFKVVQKIYRILFYREDGTYTVNSSLDYNKICLHEKHTFDKLLELAHDLATTGVEYDTKYGTNTKLSSAYLTQALSRDPDGNVGTVVTWRCDIAKIKNFINAYLTQWCSAELVDSGKASVNDLKDIQLHQEFSGRGQPMLYKITHPLGDIFHDRYDQIRAQQLQYQRL